MASFAALVASLASRVQGTAIRRCAVSGDVTKLSTSVALHRLRLAVARKVVRPAALVAGSRPRATSEAASAEASKSAAARDGTTTSHRHTGRVGASTS